MTSARPRRIVWLLAAATAAPIVVLSSLGWRVLQQDGDAERQRQREALQVSGLRFAVEIERHLQEIETRLGRGDGIGFSPEGLTARPGQPLLYQPIALPSPARRSADLVEAEAAEHRRRDLGAAAALYRKAASSSDRSLRATALLGLGRVLRQNGDREHALAAYRELEVLGPVTVAEQPAALVARQARARLFAEAGDRPRLGEEAVGLARALEAGGWLIDRATFEVYRDLIVEWGGPAPDERAALRTEAAIRLWQAWRDRELPPSGRRTIALGTQAALAVWAGSPERPVASLLLSNELDAVLQPLSTAQALHVVARDADGRKVFGAESSGGVTLMPAETRLPFVLSVTSKASTADGSMRRAVLIGGLSGAFLLMVAAAYGLYRATSRELALAEQQKAFVSAVSHEFRTPLTSMRHLTDLLATRGVTSEERRAHYYHLLAHETERLHRMVENLLSFGRIEAGAYAWRLEPLDAGLFLRQLVDEFRTEPQASGRQIQCDVEEHLPAIRADVEALSRAVWNLLENAAKYSEPTAPIHVFARRSGSSVALGVDDRGTGIPVEEQARIFETFVRGADTVRTRVRGVGLGLALVKRIVEAHGGSVQVASTPGRGSTFTLVIPCLPS